ncbi:MAG TPA: hypothetical protein VLK89_03940 [Solirubrobacterales bacterium]|nr:hypothetical protein [Solirubrobacterales bacterium]
MSRRTVHIFGLALTLIAFSLALGACGGSGASQDEIDQARKEGATQTKQQLKIKQIEDELHSLKHGHAVNQTQAQAPSGTSSVGTSGGSSSCGGTLSVGPNTTCGFAANVEADYYSEVGSGSGTVYSYSPTTGRYYTMYCSAGAPHTCTGGNNASVYFP